MICQIKLNNQQQGVQQLVDSSQAKQPTAQGVQQLVDSSPAQVDTIDYNNIKTVELEHSTTTNLIAAFQKLILQLITKPGRLSIKGLNNHERKLLHEACDDIGNKCCILFYI